MKFISAGESHGKALAGIIEGLPSKLKIDIDEINAYLALRQSGYGRGGRQKIERDTVEILSGVRNMCTLGSPLAFLIKNKDYENWRAYMAPEGCDVTQRALTRVRPGHADLTGMLKYGTDDARNILERASARETAARVVAGTIARQYLRRLGIEVCGYVKSVCGICDDKYYEFEQLSAAKGQPLFMLDNALQDKAVALVDELKRALKSDKAPCKVSAMSQFGLVEFTRKRMGVSPLPLMIKPCRYCNEAGYTKTTVYILLNMRAKLLNLIADGAKKIRMDMNADVCKRLAEWRELVQDLTARGAEIYAVPHRTYHEELIKYRLDDFDIPPEAIKI